MLGEFARIVDEVVRGAEQLRGALVRAEESLARTAASLSAQAGSLGAVLNLDRFAAGNARQITQALSGGGPAGAFTVSDRLRDQLRRLEPSVERIARELPRNEARGAPSPRGGRVSIQGLQRKPQRGTVGRMSLLQHLLHTRRARVWRWRMERSRSPLRRYVGQSLRRYAEHGNFRRLLIELSRAKGAMQSPATMQQAARAGISADSLARSASTVASLGRLGLTAARAAAALGPFAAAIAAAVIVTVKVYEALWRFVRAMDDAVLNLRHRIEPFTKVHGGMAVLAAQMDVARLQETRRVARGTYQTTALYAKMAESYRREGEDLRTLQQNMKNLVGIAGLILARTVKIGMGITVLERLAKPINQALEGILNWLASSGFLPPVNPQPNFPYVDWLEELRSGGVRRGRRRPPREPFNRGPQGPK